MKTYLTSAGVAGALIVGSTAVLAATGATETKVVDRLSGAATPAVAVPAPQEEVEIPTGPVKNTQTFDLGNGTTRTRTNFQDGSYHDRDCTSAGMCRDHVYRPGPSGSGLSGLDYTFSAWYPIVGVAAVVGIVAASDSSESD